MNTSKSQSTPLHHASTPTANYVVTPRSLVSPGTLSRNVSRQWSRNPAGIPVQRKDSSKSSLKLKIIPPVQAVNPKGALVVSPTQGIFEIRLKYFDVSDTGLQRIANHFEDETPTIRISWKFLSFDRSSIPLPTSKGAHYPIEYSVLYKIDINESFFEYVLTRELSMQLHARGSTKEVFLARGELKLNDILEYPLNELYAYMDFCDVDKALLLSNTGIAVVYGTLTLWYRLSCDVDVLGAFLNRVGHIYYSPSTSTAADKQQGGQRKSSVMTLLRNPELSLGSRKTSLVFHLPEELSNETESFNSLEPTDSEVESFKEALDLVLSRNKALRTTQSEISNELRDRARWLHEESNWKRTLQEHAILAGKNPADVEWRQWRDASTANVKLRSYPSQLVIYPPEVVITIEYLKLYRGSPPLKGNKFKKFYVEYSFLTHEGEEMECPVSVAKSEEGKRMVFNFTKRFSIDPQKSPGNCQKLAEAIKNGEDIKFVVVGEPEDEPSANLCCEEVSSCAINMLELVQLESNELVDALLMHDPESKIDEIGYLKVRISGVQSMRRVALRLLAPPDYTILE